MKARKQLLAAGTTVTLIAGGVLLGATPASAAHNSPECLSAQAEFTTALHNAAISADLRVAIALALQDLVEAQEVLDLIELEGAATIEEIDPQIVEALVRVRQEQLPNLNAIINSASEQGKVAEARLLLEAFLGGPLDSATADALLALNIPVENFLLAEALDEASLLAAIEASADLNEDQKALLTAAILTGEVDQATIDALLDVRVNVDGLIDQAALQAAIEAAIAEMELTIDRSAKATVLVQLLETGDINAVLDADAELDAVLGADLDLSVLAELREQRAAAQALLDAQAELDAALEVINNLRIELDALDIDVVELEALFNLAIETCTEAGAVVGGDNDGDNGNHDNGAGGVGVGGGAGTGTAVTAGTQGTNRGFNVQTAATASTDPAGIGALTAGLGLLVVAGAGVMTARRVRNS